MKSLFKHKAESATTLFLEIISLFCDFENNSLEGYILSVKLKEANCQWPACNARTTATGTGSQVTLVAQAANGVAIAGVAPGGTVDVPVAWHALVAQVANHVLPAQALPVLLTAVPTYRAWPVTLAWQAS